jgi:hypothetical protein
MDILNLLKSQLGLDKDTCQAVVGKSSDCLCENKIYGRGCRKGYNFKFCSKHIPSDAIPAGGRVESVEFYIPESDTTIQVD